jgi:ubiquinone/menaquinone biosynthesis C-methylase UbiE
MLDPRDDLIRRVAPGRQFVDIGGLWGVVREKVTIAAQAGASELNLMDISPKEDPQWAQMTERLVSLGVTKCNYIQGDILNITIKPFQVVYSSGILYHLADPFSYLKKLRHITSEYAIITTAITQELVQNQFGTYSLPKSGVCFVPALTPQERQILAAYWAPLGNAMGITSDCTYSLEDQFACWWFLPTREAFRRMVEISKFEIVDSCDTWLNNAHCLLVR